MEELHSGQLLWLQGGGGGLLLPCLAAKQLPRGWEKLLGSFSVQGGGWVVKEDDREGSRRMDLLEMIGQKA